MSTEPILFGTYALLVTQQRLRHGRVGFATDTARLVLRDLLGAFHFFDTLGTIYNTTRIAASPYNVLETDHVIFVDTDGGGIIVNLPAGIEGTNYRVINSGTSGNAVTLTPNGVDQLFKGGAGVATTFYDGEVADIVYNVTEGWM